MLQSFEGFEPTVDSTAWVHSSAWIIGQVELGPGSSVWPTAVLRGDMGAIRIGKNSNVQDGVVVHMTDVICDTMVGDRCTIGHRAILHSCNIANDCIVGMGAIVMDASVIGEGCIIAAGAVVTMNKVIPPGSLVMGSPARVVRELTDKDHEWIDYSWRIYARKAAVWRANENDGA